MSPPVESIASREAVRLSSTVASLFPAGAVAAELRGTADSGDLYPEEAGWCAGFARKRRADFAAGRLCARRALREFGYHGFALQVNADRRPAWPAGLVGSISHTAGYCGAVVGRAEHFASIGFDAEPIGGVGEELWPELFVAQEGDYLRSLAPEARAKAATVLFSAKEAYYKCHFGITPTWLDFTDVVVALEEATFSSGAFVVHPVAERRGSLAEPRNGRYALDGEIALTGVASPCERPRDAR